MLVSQMAKYSNKYPQAAAFITSRNNGRVRKIASPLARTTLAFLRPAGASFSFPVGNSEGRARFKPGRSFVTSRSFLALLTQAQPLSVTSQPRLLCSSTLNLNPSLSKSTVVITYDSSRSTHNSRSRRTKPIVSTILTLIVDRGILVVLVQTGHMLTFLFAPGKTYW